MSDVACAALGLYLRELERRGIPTARLAEGSAYTLTDLRDPRKRIPWGAFARFTERTQELIGGPEAMREMGRHVLDVPAMWSLYAVLGLIVAPRRLYRAVSGYLGPLLFTNLDSWCDEAGERELRIGLRIPGDQAACPAFFQVCAGAFEVLPRALGYPPSRVVLEAGPREARYAIEVAPRPFRLGRLFGLFKRRHEAPALTDEVFRQQEVLRRALRRQRESEKALRASKARWRSLAENAPDIILSLDTEGRVRFANRLDPALDPSAMGDRLADHFEPEMARRLDERLGEVIEEARRVRFELSWVRPGSGERFWYACTAGPVTQQGEVTGIVFVARDVTEARQRAEERQELEQQMLRAQRLESLGVLARGVGHDFNNLLTGIAGNADLALLHLDEDHPARCYVQRMVDTTVRASALTGQLLAYAGQAGGEREPVDVAEVVEALTDLMIASVPKRVRLVCDLDDTPRVAADPSQLQQVVLNLITNAAEAIAEQGEVVLRTQAVEVAEDYELPGALTTMPAPGAYVELAVHDTGAGMEPDTLDRIFDPFFSTKAEGRGLGLAAVLGIVGSHDGALAVQSTPGEGTLFRVLLPVAEVQRPPQVAEAGVPEPDAPCTVLVIDDEAVVRDTVATLLTGAGYDVLTAEDGDHGMALWSARRDEVDVVLVDLAMPGRSGTEVYRAIRAADSDVPVVLTSAYDESEAGLRPGEEVPFLRKPYRRPALLEVLSAARASTTR